MVKNMHITWYPWLNKSYKNIIYNYQTKKLHHAIIIESYNIKNSIKLIQAISQWILCENKNNIHSCGKCKGCILFLANNHPDLYKLFITTSENTLDILKIRKTIHNLQNTSQQNCNKILWIKDYQTLTIFGINTLLKIIEEPPQDTLFFIGKSINNNLHLTLQSRCILYRIPTPVEKQGVFWIQKQLNISKNMSIIELRINNHDPELALQSLKNKKWIQRIKVFQILELSIHNDNFLKLLPILNTQNGIVKIYWIILILLDSLKIKKKMIPFLINLDQMNLITKMSNKYSFDYLYKILYSWIQCRHHLIYTKNINQELLILQQLLKWNMIKTHIHIHKR